MKTLFVCSGNVGRSQMAEGYYNYYTSSQDGFSAGTSHETPGLYPELPDVMCQLMAEEGIDISKQKVKTIDESFVAAADRIFVLCEKERCPNFLLSSGKVTYWEIKDPYQISVDEMREIRNKIRASVKSIL